VDRALARSGSLRGLPLNGKFEENKRKKKRKRKKKKGVTITIS
jgi:hypothetical protein